MKLSDVRALRRLVLPILRNTAFDFGMRHPYVPSVRITLNSYLHKGYWYKRKRREAATMVLFSELIERGMNVVEVGGHIGFISIYFMKLIGPNGSLSVFEPGQNNLPYIRKNLKAAKSLVTDVTLIEQAVGDYEGEVSFFEDELTGQNNSVVKDFEGFKSVAAKASVEAKTIERKVKLTTLDSVFSDKQIDFIKIDVEGFEKSVLMGALELIEHVHPLIMVEIQADREAIFKLFKERDYLLFLENRTFVEEPGQLRGNVFALHRSTHSSLIRSVFDFSV